MAEKVKFNSNVWQTPLIPAIPDDVHGVQNNKISISNRKKGEWRFLYQELTDIPSPYAENQDYDFSNTADCAWQDVIVPASLNMQGFDIENNKEYYYTTTVKIPSDYAHKRVLLRFEGVYSNARIWINGEFIRSHVGGFTPFDCDITKFADAGSITLVVGIADIEGTTAGIWNPDGKPLGDCSLGSFYGHNNICGILRNVTLLALDKKFIGRIHTESNVLQDGNANLTVALEIQLSTQTAVSPLGVKLELFDAEEVPKGVIYEALQDVHKAAPEPLPEFTMKPDSDWCSTFHDSAENDRKNEKLFVYSAQAQLTGYDPYGIKLEMPISDPVLWNAENPYLYKLQISLVENGTTIQKNSISIGIREIGYGGANGGDKNKLYINGSEIKLRGVCRHDISYQYGRSLTCEEELEEILAYKRNNINFIRTSHYPISENMLNLCDRYGIYVEQENAACFKGANGIEIYCAPQDFVCGFAEMVEYSRNHPSVIIWSLANESGFEKTYAFRTEYQYIKEVDTTRPVIFSYPNTVQSEPHPYDIFSMHYQDVDGELGLPDLPKLHDEFAHVACYNLEDLKMDNNIRNVWGESIKRGWDHIFETDGALGCAIWAGIDDVFLLPQGVQKRHQCHSEGQAAGYGEWGAILDVYKREKPEAYLTKKAFSPILLEESSSVIVGKKAVLQLKNRFDHTDLNSIRTVCIGKDGKKLYDGALNTSILPHQSGSAEILLSDASDEVTVTFYKEDIPIDSGVVSAPTEEIETKFDTALFLTREETNHYIRYRSTGMSVYVNRENGDVKLYDAQTGELIIDGVLPYFKGILPPKQSNIQCSYEMVGGKAKINLKRDYSAGISVETQILFSGAAVVIQNQFIPADNHFDALEKLGVSLGIDGQVTAVSWEREGLYSLYPAHHIGRNCGTAFASAERADVHLGGYGQKPDWRWEHDMVNYFLDRAPENKQNPHTNDFKSTRDAIKRYSVTLEGDRCIEIIPIGKNISAFTSWEAQHYCLTLSKGNYYPSLAWGNYLGKKVDESCYELSFMLTSKMK